MAKKKELDLISSDANYRHFVSVFTNNFPHKHYSELFNDFLDYCLWFLSKPFGDLAPKEVIEAGTRLEETYKAKDGAAFGEMFQAFINAADDDGNGLKDVLGDLFMELVSHGQGGQFFTPQCICDMMAMQTVGDSLTEERQTVCDPACGSGRMMFGVAKLSRRFKFYNADIDAKCCKMTTINMLLNSLSGEVAHMNTLSCEYWKSYHVYNIGLPHFRITYNVASSGFFVPKEPGLTEAKDTKPKEVVKQIVAPQVLIDLPKNGVAHMVASNVKLLHLFAASIGLKQCWFENNKGKGHPHYDVKGAMIVKAIEAGARQVSSKELVAFIKNLKN